jgi:hypothetical protein
MTSVTVATTTTATALVATLRILRCISVAFPLFAARVALPGGRLLTLLAFLGTLLQRSFFT